MNANNLKNDLLIPLDGRSDISNESITIKGFFSNQENIGMMLVCGSTFCNAFGAFFTKVIQRTYPNEFHTVPFLFMRSFTILLLAYIRARYQNEAILRPNEISNKFWFFIRTNINFFSISAVTMAIWYLRTSTAQIINSLSPILIFILSYFFLEEAFYFRYIIGIIVCISGSLFIVLNERNVKNDNYPNNATNYIDTLIGVGCASFSALGVALVALANKILVNFKVSINSQMFYVGISTMMYSSIYVLFFGGVELKIGYLLMCCFHGYLFFLANIGFNLAMQKTSLTKTVLISYLQVVFVFILSYLFLHEAIFFTDLIGAGLILSFMFYNGYYPLPKIKQQEEPIEK